VSEAARRFVASYHARCAADRQERLRSGRDRRQVTRERIEGLHQSAVELTAELAEIYRQEDEAWRAYCAVVARAEKVARKLARLQGWMDGLDGKGGE
jgi:hypothetical protein